MEGKQQGRTAPAVDKVGPRFIILCSAERRKGIFTLKNVCGDSRYGK